MPSHKHWVVIHKGSVTTLCMNPSADVLWKHQVREEITCPECIDIIADRKMRKLLGLKHRNIPYED